ncbi:MAG: hypothetical protein RBT68_07435 [Spirochaetia bacterium]|jgi:D-glycero-alpha-D-manno-heptose-7-phosphate kinase|nr:hypothetical protein [Spirochaetia bacterium]
MILTKTPLRIPLAGGLTDLKGYADRFGGTTVSATIDKYIFIAVKKNLGKVFDLHYLNAYEKADTVEDIRHNHIREAIKLTGLGSSHLDLTIMNDLNHEGGLGSSGALTAGLLSALNEHKEQPVDDSRIISDSSKIEMEILEGASGYHDHTITQLGGFRLINYEQGTPAAMETDIPAEHLKRFLKRFMLFYSGFHAKTKPSLALLADNLDSVLAQMDAMKANAHNLIEALVRGDINGAGECVQRQQDLKQKLPGSFENEFVVETMRRARKLGVFAQIPGGKIGAFLIVYRPPGIKRKKVIKHFGDLQHIPFRFVAEGTRSVRL